MKTENSLSFPNDWNSFLKKILKECSNIKRGICSILLLGPKNTGKTTFSTTIINNIIGNNDCKNNQIYILDCDLGQPLISPMSCVKLVRWENKNIPIKQTGNINILTELMFYIGGNNPMNYPSRYLKGIKQCIEYIKCFEDKKIILILNMPGWITGVGLEISSIITSLCIDISTKVFIGFTKQFQDISNNEDDKNIYFISKFDLNLVKNLKNKEIIIDNQQKTKILINTLSDLFDDKLNNNISKNTNPLNCFDDYIGFYQCLNTIFLCKCKTVHFPFNSIYIIPSPNTTIKNEDIKFHMPYRLTNSIVALCIFKDEQNQFIPNISEDENKLNILDTCMILPCIGLGIVHHINYNTNFIIVNVPNWIPGNTISEVNIIQLTEMMLPHYYPCYTSKPYICKKTVILRGISSGGKVPKNRKNIKRKIHNL